MLRVRIAATKLAAMQHAVKQDSSDCNAGCLLGIRMLQLCQHIRRFLGLKPFWCAGAAFAVAHLPMILRDLSITFSDFFEPDWLASRAPNGAASVN